MVGRARALISRLLTAPRPGRARFYQRETPIMIRCVTTFDRSASMAILGFGQHEEVQRTHEFRRFADLCDDTVARVKELAHRFGALLVEDHKKFPPPKN
jgi:hypothetical protein